MLAQGKVRCRCTRVKVQRTEVLGWHIDIDKACGKLRKTFMSLRNSGNSIRNLMDAFLE